MKFIAALFLLLFAFPAFAAEPRASEKLFLFLPFLACLALLALYLAALPRILTYQLAQTGLQVRYFGVLFFNFRYADIREARLVTGRDLWRFGFFTARFGNRFARSAIRIVSVTGFRKNILITPPEPEKFLAELKTRFANSG